MIRSIYGYTTKITSNVRGKKRLILTLGCWPIILKTYLPSKRT